jgi:hypothetical protein
MSKALFIIFATFCSIALGESKPRITKIVIRYTAPDLTANSSGSRPKTMYLAGDRYARIDEVGDAEGNNTIIVNEPDIWLFDSQSKLGRHTRNSGPDLTVHNPILGPDGPGDLFDFEFGHEIAFLDRVKAKSVGSEKIGSVNCVTRELKAQNYVVIVDIDQSRNSPVEIKTFRDGKLTFKISYLSYETGMVFEPSLFEPPKAISFVDQN